MHKTFFPSISLILAVSAQDTFVGCFTSLSGGQSSYAVNCETCQSACQNTATSDGVAYYGFQNTLVSELLEDNCYCTNQFPGTYKLADCRMDFLTGGIVQQAVYQTYQQPAQFQFWGCLNNGAMEVTYTSEDAVPQQCYQQCVADDKTTFVMQTNKGNGYFCGCLGGVPANQPADECRVDSLYIWSS